DDTVADHKHNAILRPRAGERRWPTTPRLLGPDTLSVGGTFRSMRMSTQQSCEALMSAPKQSGDSPRVGGKVGMQIGCDNRIMAIDILAHTVAARNAATYRVKWGFDPRIMKGVAAQLALGQCERL